MVSLRRLTHSPRTKQEEEEEEEEKGKGVRDYSVQCCGCRCWRKRSIFTRRASDAPVEPAAARRRGGGDGHCLIRFVLICVSIASAPRDNGTAAAAALAGMQHPSLSPAPSSPPPTPSSSPRTQVDCLLVITLLAVAVVRSDADRPFFPHFSGRLTLRHHSKSHTRSKMKKKKRRHLSCTELKPLLLQRKKG